MGGAGGPPPAEEDKIKALLHFKISGDEVTNGVLKNQEMQYLTEICACLWRIGFVLAKHTSC